MQWGLLDQSTGNLHHPINAAPPLLTSPRRGGAITARNCEAGPFHRTPWAPPHLIAMGDLGQNGGGGWLSGAWSLGQSMYNAAASAVNRCDQGGRWRGAGGSPAAAAGLFKRELPPGSLRPLQDLALVLQTMIEAEAAGQQRRAAASMRPGLKLCLLLAAARWATRTWMWWIPRPARPRARRGLRP